MNKPVTLNLIQRTVADATSAVSAPAEHPQSLLELPPGAARESLLEVHHILCSELPQGELELYEAGGGSTSFLPLALLRRARITLVDIDEEQISNNDYAQQRILGDIQSHRFPPDSFNLAVCYNVIEHLADVEAALKRICESLKQGGLILIGAPNPKSLSGIVTRYSPHRFHVWYYRHVRGIKNAGQPGQAPFPTFFHPLVTPSRLQRFAESNGLELIHRRDYESPRFPEMRARQPVLAALLDAFAVMLNRLLAGDGDVRRGDYHMILRKR